MKDKIRTQPFLTSGHHVFGRAPPLLYAGFTFKIKSALLTIIIYHIAGNFRRLKISDKVENLLGIKFRIFNFRSFEICTIL